jgi:hypothetical protein
VVSDCPLTVLRGWQGGAGPSDGRHSYDRVCVCAGALPLLPRGGVSVRTVSLILSVASYLCARACFRTQLSATDVSARTTMKGAAKCDKHCELQNSVNQQGLERILRFRDIPESMPASVSIQTHSFERLSFDERLRVMAERGLAERIALLGPLCLDASSAWSRFALLNGLQLPHGSLRDLSDSAVNLSQSSVLV